MPKPAVLHQHRRETPGAFSFFLFYFLSPFLNEETMSGAATKTKVVLPAQGLFFCSLSFGGGMGRYELHRASFKPREGDGPAMMRYASGRNTSGALMGD